MKKYKLIIVGAALAVFAFCLLPFAFSAETVPQTQTVLKSYFNPTGATPGTNEFNELIDTMFFYINVTGSNAAAAAASAAASASNAPTAYGIVQFVTDGMGDLIGTPTWRGLFRCSGTNVVSGLGWPLASVSFSALADTNYVVLLTPEGAATNAVVYSRSLTNFTFRLYGKTYGSAAAVNFTVLGQ